MALEVTLYGRPDCHLCAQARAELAELAAGGSAFEVREVDIESDDGLFKEMLERIPVVELGGRVVSELEFDRHAFSAALHTVSP